MILILHFSYSLADLFLTLTSFPTLYLSRSPIFNLYLNLLKSRNAIGQLRRLPVACIELSQTQRTRGLLFAIGQTAFATNSLHFLNTSILLFIVQIACNKRRIQYFLEHNRRWSSLGLGKHCGQFLGDSYYRD